jgi:IS5 family transposase
VDLLHGVAAVKALQHPRVEIDASGAARGLNKPKLFPADAGYFSEANVDACEAAGIEPLIAIRGDEHHGVIIESLQDSGRSSGHHR